MAFGADNVASLFSPQSKREDAAKCYALPGFHQCWPLFRLWEEDEVVSANGAKPFVLRASRSAALTALLYEALPLIDQNPFACFDHVPELMRSRCWLISIVAFGYGERDGIRFF